MTNDDKRALNLARRKRNAKRMVSEIIMSEFEKCLSHLKEDLNDSVRDEIISKLLGKSKLEKLDDELIMLIEDDIYAENESREIAQLMLKVRPC